jgi:hypothetical protein
MSGYFGLCQDISGHVRLGQGWIAYEYYDRLFQITSVSFSLIRVRYRFAYERLVQVIYG